MKRMFLLAAAAAMTTVSLAGCSKGNTTTASNETQSTQAPTTTEAATPTTKKSSTGSSSPDTTGRRTTGSTGTTTRSGGNSSTTLPGIPDIPGGPDVTDIPGVPKNVQKCVDISTAYLALFTPFISGNGYDKQALDQAVATLDRIKSEVPANVAAALQTLEDGIKNIKSQSDMVAFFTSDEFTKNNDIVTKYVTVECQTAG